MSRALTGRLVIATHNAGKAAEFARLLAPHGVEVVSAGELGLSAPEETGTTFEENARIKAQAAARASGLPALADDSGLEVAALGGAPGVYTADWAETEDGRDYRMAMSKVRDALRAKAAPEPWRAAFRCQLCVIWPDGAEAQIAGRAPGRLVWPPRGQIGFGFDPMFIPDAGEGDQTFAELAPEEKNRLSHRADAFAKLAAAHLGDPA